MIKGYDGQTKKNGIMSSFFSLYEKKFFATRLGPSWPFLFVAGHDRIDRIEN